MCLAVTVTACEAEAREAEAREAEACEAEAGEPGERVSQLWCETCTLFEPVCNVQHLHRFARGITCARWTLQTLSARPAASASS